MRFLFGRLTSNLEVDGLGSHGCRSLGAVRQNERSLSVQGLVQRRDSEPCACRLVSNRQDDDGSLDEHSQKARKCKTFIST